MVETLGEVGSEEAIPHLLKVLRDDNYDMRWRAAEGLCRLGCVREATPELLKALEDDSDSLVRWRAAISLGKLGFVETIPRL